MEALQTIVAAVLDRLVDVLLFPLDPGNRIFYVYLATSVLCAWFVYRAIRKRGDSSTLQDKEDASGSFIAFLLPRRVWSHPSAWLDLRYMVFHKVVSHFLLLGLGAWSITVGFTLSSGGVALGDIIILSGATNLQDILAATVFMIITALVADFIGWATHYLQHKIPLLWQFHKVHHSAEVMHPISNFREHPIDNFVYGLFIGLGYGVVAGLAVRFIGVIPSVPALLGVPLLMFAFNFVGYNLRHSHIWLRWPGVWSKVFPSPAHHHVHHSCHPDHIDKNFAFMFPFWDVVFGTYHMPEDNRDIVFGIDEDSSELNSCVNLYWIPFRDAWRLFRRSEQEENQAPAEKHSIPAE